MTLEGIGMSATGPEDIWICSDCLKKEYPLGHVLGILKDGHCAGCEALCVVMLYNSKRPVKRPLERFSPEDKNWDGGAE
jgi:hypothetical protein